MKRELTQAARAAQAIRKVLKQKFPEVKFSVRSKSFSMGDEVNVRWVDGPTEREVEKEVNHFQKGSFDGMQDIYEYSNSRDDIPQTKYLFCIRKISYAKAQEVARYLLDYRRIEVAVSPQGDTGYKVDNGNDYCEQLGCWMNSAIHRGIRLMEEMEENE